MLSFIYNLSKISKPCIQFLILKYLNLFLILLVLKKKLFLYFWLYWVFAAAWAFLLMWCMGFSLQWLLSLQSTGSRVHGLQELQVLCLVVGYMGLVTLCLVNLARAGIKPVSPALQGGFLTIGPQLFLFFSSSDYYCV